MATTAEKAPAAKKAPAKAAKKAPAKRAASKKAASKKAATKPPGDAAEKIRELAPPPPPEGSRASKTFVRKAGSVADDVTAFVADARKRVEKLTDAHVEATAAHTGASGHEAVAFELRRVGSTFADLDLALSAVSATAGRLAAEASTVEG